MLSVFLFSICNSEITLPLRIKFHKTILQSTIQISFLKLRYIFFFFCEGSLPPALVQKRFKGIPELNICRQLKWEKKYYFFTSFRHICSTVFTLLPLLPKKKEKKLF